MKAIKVTVDYGEWSKVSDFLRELDGEDLFSYQIDNVSFVIVANGEYSMSWADRKSTRLNSSHSRRSRMPSSA